MTPLFSITLEAQGWIFSADGSVSLLMAAEQAGLRLPSSCRNGSCRTCICRLSSGRIHYRIDWPGLSKEEKAEGYILPCVAFPESDIRLDARAVKRV